MKKKRLFEKVRKTIKEFNRYRAPEVVARMVSTNEEFRIKFTGPYCKTCGFYDYFDDFKVFLEEIGLKVKIIEIKEIDEGAVVRFKPEYLKVKMNGRRENKEW
jgi:superoxide reductase